MRKALFLDRDGVINKDYGYVHKKDNFEFIEGIFELIKSANNLSYLVIVITNQAGIGRNIYSEDTFLKLTLWMCKKFQEKDCIIDAIYYCPYHPIYGQGEFKKDSYLRKPNPGMIIEASNKHEIDLCKSILVGDKEHDIEAGLASGILKNYLFSQEAKTNKKYNLINNLNEIIL